MREAYIPTLEQNHRNPITVVFGSHWIASDGPRTTHSQWSRETEAKVLKMVPRPTVFVVDGLFPGGYYGDILDQGIPVEDINHFGTPGQSIHVLAADVLTVSQFDESSEDEKRYRILLEAAGQKDPAFTDEDVNASFRNRLILSAVGEMFLPLVVSQGLREYFLKKYSESKGSLGYDPVRRHVLQLTGLAVIAATINVFRVPVLGQTMLLTEATQNQSLADQIALAIKPSTLNNSIDDIRNAKMGLATLAYLSTAEADESAAIVLGTGHKLAEFPGQPEWESVTETTQRLVQKLAQEVGPIIEIVKQTHPEIPDAQVAADFKLWLATYDVYEAPQYGGRDIGPKFTDTIVTNTIPSIEKCIDALVYG